MRINRSTTNFFFYMCVVFSLLVKDYKWIWWLVFYKIKVNCGSTGCYRNCQVNLNGMFERILIKTWGMMATGQLLKTMQIRSSKFEGKGNDMKNPPRPCLGIESETWWSLTKEWNPTCFRDQSHLGNGIFTITSYKNETDSIACIINGWWDIMHLQSFLVE